MSLVLIEGFDGMNSAAGTPGSGWTGNNFNTAAPGRFGDGRYAGMSSSSISFVSHATVIAGWAITSGITWSASLGNTTSNVSVTWNVSDNSLTLFRGASAVQTSPPNTCFGAVWNYIELKVYTHTTAGSHAIRLNGVPITNMPDVTNVNTNASGTGVTSYWSIATGAAFQSFSVDDLYICNGAGSVNNNFLGDVRVETLYPVGAGSATNWTPVAVTSNWQAVDEMPQNDDTDYVTASGVGVKDLYAMSNLATPVGTVFGVQCDIRARKTDSGTRGVVGVFKSGATEADTTTFGTIAATYMNFREIREDKPGGTGWTIADVNAMEMGVKVTV